MSELFPLMGSDYSTVEKVIGRWIDGKPLYSRVIQLGDVNANSEKTFSLLTTYIPDLENILYRMFVSKLNSNGMPLFIPGTLCSASGEARVEARLNGFRQSEICAWAKNYHATYSATVYLILQYTKTTD